MKTLAKRIEETKIKNDPLYAELWQYNGIMLEMKKQWVFSVTEKYGLYDGQIQFCKKVAYEIYKTKKSYKKSYEQLSKDFDKGIFFSYIEVNYIPNIKNEYRTNSKLDSNTDRLDKIIIYIDSLRTKDRGDLLTKIVHEMTHAYGQYVSLLKNAPITPEQISKSHFYKYITSDNSNHIQLENAVKTFLYYTSSVEKQAFTNEIAAVIEKLKDKYKNRAATYDEYLKEIKSLEFVQYANKISDIIDRANENILDIQLVTNIYNKANNTNLSCDKVIKKLNLIGQEFFKRLKKNIARLYYEYVEEFRNKIDESIPALVEIEMWPIYKHWADYETAPENDFPEKWWNT